MKKPERSTKAPAPRGKPLDPRQFPLGPQLQATAGRERTREVAYPVRAPRQSQRRVEKSGKRQPG